MSFAPGTFVIYQSPSPGRPGWPAVVCSSYDVPTRVRRKRRKIYEFPILLLQKHIIRWVSDEQVQKYHNQTWSEDEDREHPGLKDAYSTLLNAILDQVPMDVFRAVIEETYRTEFDEDNNDESSSASQGSDLVAEKLEQDADPDLKHTASQSLEQQKRKRSASATRAEPRSPEKVMLATGRGTMHNTPSPLADAIGRAETPIIRHRRPNESAIPTGEADFGSHQPQVSGNRHRGSSLGVNLEVQPASEELAKQRCTPIEQLSTAEDKVDWINDDPKFVEFHIGPERKSYHIPYDAVRDHGFCARNLGFVRPRDRGQGWIFERPCLVNIQPDEFDFVADFLYTQDFGHRVIENQEQGAESFVQCAGAWIAGEELGIEALLTHVVHKLPSAAPWNAAGMDVVLMFTARVYETPGSPSKAHEEIKGMLNAFIGEHFFEYIRDHFELFTSQIDEVPEFATDLFRFMATRAEQKAAQRDAEMDGRD